MQEKRTENILLHKTTHHNIMGSNSLPHSLNFHLGLFHIYVLSFPSFFNNITSKRRRRETNRATHLDSMQLSFTLSPQNPIRLFAKFLLILSPFSSYATRSSSSSLICSSSKHVDNCFPPNIVEVMDSLQRQVAFRSWGNDSITSPLPKVHASAQCHDDLSSLDCRKSRGYMAPEYLVRGQLTEKADVYGFGVLVLETATGRKNSVFLQVWKHYKVKTITDMIDPGLKDSSPEKQAETVLQKGLLFSTITDMNEVVSMLANARSEIPSPKQPPFLNASVLSPDGSTESCITEVSFTWNSVIDQQTKARAVTLNDPPNSQATDGPGSRNSLILEQTERT